MINKKKNRETNYICVRVFKNIRPDPKPSENTILLGSLTVYLTVKNTFRHSEAVVKPRPEDVWLPSRKSFPRLLGSSRLKKRQMK